MRLFLRTIGVLFERMIGIDEKARSADMHLPERMLGLSLSSLLAVFLLVARYIYVEEIVYLILAAVFLFIFVGILLCYRNQRIYVLSDEEFLYSTFLGNKHTYKFSDIEMIKGHKDSMTMYVHKGEKLCKVHIEASAVLSKRLADLINKSLAEATSRKEKTND